MIKPLWLKISFFW